jgi:hypothetical protein
MKNIYKNQIFQHLLNHPIGIDNFEVLDNEDLFQLKYKPFPDPFFAFGFTSTHSFDSFGVLMTFYRPGYPFKNHGNLPFEFHKAFELFKSWLKEVLGRYLEDESTPNMFEEYQKRSNITVIENEDFKVSEVFTLRERESIKLGLNEIKSIIAQRFTATAEQLENTNQRIAYLQEGVDRLNKTDFKGIFINTIISIMIALSLDTQKGQELYSLFMQIIQFMPSIGN